MQNHKLGDAMFNEYEMFEDLFAGNYAFHKLGDALLKEYDPLIPSTFDKKIYLSPFMNMRLIIVFAIILKVGLEECQL